LFLERVAVKLGRVDKLSDEITGVAGGTLFIPVSGAFLHSRRHLVQGPLILDPPCACHDELISVAPVNVK
jgi:hypothetical protein